MSSQISGLCHCCSFTVPSCVFQIFLGPLTSLIAVDILSQLDRKSLVATMQRRPISRPSSFNGNSNRRNSSPDNLRRSRTLPDGFRVTKAPTSMVKQTRIIAGRNLSCRLPSISTAGSANARDYSSSIQFLHRQDESCQHHHASASCLDTRSTPVDHQYALRHFMFGEAFENSGGLPERNQRSVVIGQTVLPREAPTQHHSSEEVNRACGKDVIQPGSRQDLANVGEQYVYTLRSVSNKCSPSGQIREYKR